MANTNPELYEQDILSRLPLEITWNIFLRLSFECLSVIKSVCKSHQNIISSKDFIKTHLSKYRFIVSVWPVKDLGETPYKNIPSHCLRSLFDQSVTKTMMIDYESDGMDVVGYCNGLFCLRNFVLWNPTTREFRRLPELEQTNHRVSGFGYDGEKDDFKVFALSGYSPDRKVSVYSSKSDCWRTIGDFPYTEKSPAGGKFVNGAVHWIVGQNIRKFANGAVHWIVGQDIIISLDIKTDTFREILPPEYKEAVGWMALDTFGKSLSILCELENHVDLWVMKECGVEWTKLFRIPDKDGLTGYLPKLICQSVNGEIVLLIGKTMVLYNPNDNTFKDLLEIESQEPVDVNTYVESLVSPHR